MFSIALLVLSILVFVYLGQVVAKKKGLNPVFWGVMGGVFGPLMLPFLLLTPSKSNDTDGKLP